MDTKEKLLDIGEKPSERYLIPSTSMPYLTGDAIEPIVFLDQSVW